MSVFVPVPYCLDDCVFVVEPEVRQCGCWRTSPLNHKDKNVGRAVHVTILLVYRAKCLAGENTAVHFLRHTEGIKCEWTI